MELIIKIAWRNILRHKGKSMVIGTILFLGALLMTFGNGVISGMEKGMVKNIIDGFIGNISIISDKNETDTVLFTMMGRQVEPINNYKQIKEVLLQQSGITRFLPVGRNMAMLLNEESNIPANVYLLGVELDKYQEMFPGNITVLEGQLPDKNEKGVLFPKHAQKEIYDYTNIWYIPKNTTFNKKEYLKETKEKVVPPELKTKDNIVFLGFNDKNTSMDIRSDVKGIIKYKALNAIFGGFCIVDIESYRNSMGYFAAAEKSAEITKDKKQLLGMENANIDDMFGQDTMFVEDSTKNSEINLQVAKSNKVKEPENIDLETGAYNVVFVKTKDNADPNKVLTKLNKEFKQKKLGVRAVSWKSAAGALGSMAMLIKISLFVFVMLLFFVAIIIIVNTLSMAAIERTSEIGMMRAVGARKGFISQMFVVETAILSFFFGGLGMVIGIIVVNIVPLLNITATEEDHLLQLLYGGDKFLPMLYFTDILVIIVQLSLVTLIAVIYPVKVARGITPLDAISRD